MKKYVVAKREVYIAWVYGIEADSPEDAIKKAYHGEGDTDGLDYSHSLDTSHWTAEEE